MICFGCMEILIETLILSLLMEARPSINRTDCSRVAPFKNFNKPSKVFGLSLVEITYAVACVYTNSFDEMPIVLSWDLLMMALFKSTNRVLPCVGGDGLKRHR
ncbi:hypothetical protein SADUNF_Sadunf13G0071900 [Salix dunnii]|uniref:Uncharacterized protein n=1 Tax=Salix dunnii TaxID=1413687 RepID=A0A835JJB1_9ROSI|nr:hypothetical protein SADUNF_Sadunf13G0071900 [Salix dunnii]